MTAPSSPFLPSLQSTTTVYLPHATTAIDLLPPYHGYTFQEKNIEDGILRCHDLYSGGRAHPLHGKRETSKIEQIEGQTNSEEDITMREEDKEKKKYFKSMNEKKIPEHLSTDAAKKEEKSNAEENVLIALRSSGSSPLLARAVSVAEECHTPFSGESKTISLHKNEEMHLFSLPSSTALPSTSSSHHVSPSKMTNSPSVPLFTSVGGSDGNHQEKNNFLLPCGGTPRCGLPLPHSSFLEAEVTTPSVRLHSRDACDVIKDEDHAVPPPSGSCTTTCTMTDSHDGFPLPPQPLPCPTYAMQTASSPAPTYSSAWNQPSRLPRSAWVLGSVASFRPSVHKREAAFGFHRRQRRYPEGGRTTPLGTAHPDPNVHRVHPLLPNEDEKKDYFCSFHSAVETQEEEKKRSTVQVPPILAPVCSNATPSTLPTSFVRRTPSGEGNKGGTVVERNVPPMVVGPLVSTSSLFSPAPPPLASDTIAHRGLSPEKTSPRCYPPSACTASGVPTVAEPLSPEARSRRMIQEALEKLQSSEWFVQQYHARQQEGRSNVMRLSDESREEEGALPCRNEDGNDGPPQVREPEGTMAIRCPCRTPPGPSSRGERQECHHGVHSSSPHGFPNDARDREVRRMQDISNLEKQTTSSLAPWFAAACMTSTIPLPSPPPTPHLTIALNTRAAQLLEYNRRGTKKTHTRVHSGSLGRMHDGRPAGKDGVIFSVEGEKAVDRMDVHGAWSPPLQEIREPYLVEDVTQIRRACVDEHNRREEGGRQGKKERSADTSDGESGTRMFTEEEEKKNEQERDENKTSAPLVDTNAEAVKALFQERRDRMLHHDLTSMTIQEERPSTSVFTASSSIYSQKPKDVPQKTSSETGSGSDGMHSVEEHRSRTSSGTVSPPATSEKKTVVKKKPTVQAESSAVALSSAVPTVEKSSCWQHSSLSVGTPWRHPHHSLSSFVPVFGGNGIPVPTYWSPSAATMVEDVVRRLPRMPLFAPFEPPTAAFYFQLLAQAVFPSLSEDDRVMRWREKRQHLPWLEGRPTAVLPTVTLPFPALLPPPSPPPPPPALHQDEKRRHHKEVETKRKGHRLPSSAVADAAVGSHATPKRSRREESSSRSSSSASSSTTPHLSSSDARGPGLPLWRMSSRTIQDCGASPPTTVSCGAGTETPKDIMPQLRWVWYEEMYHRHLLVLEEEAVNPIPYYGSFGAAPGGHAALEERVRRPIALCAIDKLHAELDHSMQKAIADILQVPLPATVTSLDGTLTVHMAASPLSDTASPTYKVHHSCVPPWKEIQGNREGIPDGSPSWEKDAVLHHTHVGDFFSTAPSTSSSLLPIAPAVEGTTKEAIHATSRQGKEAHGVAEKKMFDKHVQQALHEKYAIWRKYSFYHRDLKARLNLIQEEKKARLEVLGSFISCCYPNPCRCLLWDMEILEQSAIELSPAIPSRCVFVSVVLSIGHRRIQDDLLSKRQAILDRWHARLDVMVMTFSTRNYFELDEQRQREKWSLYHEYCMHVASRRELPAHTWCVKRNLPSLWKCPTDCTECHPEEEKIRKEDEKNEEDRKEEGMPDSKTENRPKKSPLGASQEIVVKREILPSATRSVSDDFPPPAEEVAKELSRGHLDGSPAAMEMASPAGNDPSSGGSSDYLSSSSTWSSTSTSHFHEREIVVCKGAALHRAYANTQRIQPSSSPHSLYTSLLRHCRLHTIGTKDSPFCSYVKFMEIVITTVLEQEERERITAEESLAVCKIEEEACISFLFASHITAEKKGREELCMEECRAKEAWARQLWMEEWSIVFHGWAQKEFETRQSLVKKLIHRMMREGEEKVREMSALLFHQYMQESRRLQVEWWNWRRRCMTQDDITALVTTWRVEGPREQCHVEETRGRLRLLSKEDEQWKKALEVFTVVQQEYYIPRDRMVRGDEVKERCLLAIEEEESRLRENILNMNRKHYQFLLSPATRLQERKAYPESFALEKEPVQQSSCEKGLNLSTTASTVKVLSREEVPGECSPSNTFAKKEGRLAECISPDAERESHSSYAALPGDLLRHIIADVNAFVPVEELVEFFSS